MASFNSSVDRYSRQIRFLPLGADGQSNLQRSSVGIVGCGALGTFVASALARAGVGKLRILDRDVVELSNLQRQWLFTEADAAEGKLKAVAAVEALRAANSTILYEARPIDLDAANIEEHFEGLNLIVDATDNFETRFLINDYCVANTIPWIYGAAVGSYGLAMPILPDHGPCLRCVYPEAPKGAQPTCETAGVLNTITSQVASWQSALAMRILSRGADELPLSLQTFDTWEFRIRQIAFARDPDCACCGARRFDYLDGRRRAPISLCGRDAVQIHERQGKIDLRSLEGSLTCLGVVRRNEFALRFQPHEQMGKVALELTVFPDGRAIIKGTTDPMVARSAYSRYLGR